MRILSLAFVVIAVVSATPKETYWRLAALYHAQNAALQSSYTSQQKAMQEKLAEISKQISDARAVVKKDCEAQGGVFEVTDTDIICKDKTDANHK